MHRTVRFVNAATTFKIENKTTATIVMICPNNSMTMKAESNIVVMRVAEFSANFTLSFLLSLGPFAALLLPTEGFRIEITLKTVWP